MAVLFRLQLGDSPSACLSDAGAERAHVVGHDWGVALGRVFASLVPDRVDHLAVLSVGHPSTFRRMLEQREKSWYMLFSQSAGAAEPWLSDNNRANFRSWASHPDSEAVIVELEAMKSLTPALTWHRANVPPTSWVAPPVVLPAVQAPPWGYEAAVTWPYRDTDDRFGRERVLAMAL